VSFSQQSYFGSAGRRRGAAFILLCGFGLKSIFGAQTERQPTELSAKLPDFPVIAMRADFGGWLKLRSQNFVIYTDVSVSAAEDMAHELEAIALASERILPAAAPATAPIVIILPGAASEWRRLESRAGYEWRVAASVVDAKPTALVTITYDWQTLGHRSVWSSAAKALLSRRGQDGPFWFTMGFGNLFREADFDGRHLLIRDRKKEWTKIMRNGLWLQWGPFFAVNSHSPEFQAADTVERYLSQASIVTHFLLFGGDEAKGIRQWRDQQRAGAALSQKAFIAAAGEPLSAWARRVWDYTTLMPQPQFDVTGSAQVLEQADANTREMRELFILAQVLAGREDIPAEALEKIAADGVRSADLRTLYTAAMKSRAR
jgi:hypothetical protein